MILGKDFLSQFNSTEFDWRNQKIRLGETWLFLLEGGKEKWNINPNISNKQKEMINNILCDFPDFFPNNPLAPRACSTVRHRIRSLDSTIFRDKVRRIPSKWKDDVEKQVCEMLQNKIIEPSVSPFNSNPLLVNKKICDRLSKSE